MSSIYLTTKESPASLLSLTTTDRTSASLPSSTTTDRTSASLPSSSSSTSSASSSSTSTSSTSSSFDEISDEIRQDKSFEPLIKQWSSARSYDKNETSNDFKTFIIKDYSKKMNMLDKFLQFRISTSFDDIELAWQQYNQQHNCHIKQTFMETYKNIINEIVTCRKKKCFHCFIVCTESNLLLKKCKCQTCKQKFEIIKNAHTKQKLIYNKKRKIQNISTVPSLPNNPDPAKKRPNNQNLCNTTHQASTVPVEKIHMTVPQTGINVDLHKHGVPIEVIDVDADTSSFITANVSVKDLLQTKNNYIEFQNKYHLEQIEIKKEIIEDDHDEKTYYTLFIDKLQSKIDCITDKLDKANKTIDELRRLQTT